MNTHIEPSDDTEYVMPCAEALLAATLALMTGHAQSACPRQRGLMARKILSNLFFLGRHPGVTASFRRVVQRMQGHWDALLATAAGGTSLAPVEPSGPRDRAEPRGLWHGAPARLQ